MERPYIALDGASLTLDAVRAVADHAAPVRLAPEAAERMRATRAIVDDVGHDGISTDHSASSCASPIRSAACARSAVRQALAR